MGVGTIAELQAKPDREYPLLWLSNEGGTLDNNYKVDNIRLTMFGRVTVGDEGQDDDASELEVLSDMQLILLDFLNYFHQNHGQEYVTDKSNTLEHFTERTNDRTAGYSTVLELKQFYDWNKCQIPQSGASIPPSVDGLTLYDFCDADVIARLTPDQITCLQAEFGGADATVNVNSSLFDTVSAGGILNVPVQYENGTPVGTITGGVVEIPDPVSCPSVEVTVYSDSGFTNPITEGNIGETVYIKAVASDITPTSYRFIFECADNVPQLLYEGVNDNTSWTVSGTQGVGRFFGYVTDDDENWVGEDEDFEVTGDPDVLAFIAATGISDVTIEEALNVMVSSFKSDGIWDKMNAIYPFVGGTSSAHKYNLKDAQDTDAAFRLDFSGGWTHDANGITGNGSNAYADTHLTASTTSNANDEHFSIYSRTDANSLTIDMGADNPTIKSNILSRYGGQFYARLQGGFVSGSSVSDSLGLFVSNRVSSSEVEGFANGTQYTKTDSSTGRSTVPYFIGALNNNGSAAFYSLRNIAFATIGDGLTVADEANFRNAVVTFQTTLGRNV